VSIKNTDLKTNWEAAKSIYCKGLQAMSLASLSSFNNGMKNGNTEGNMQNT
jgi:hypothetical protein